MTTTLATTPTGQNVRLVGMQTEEKLARRLER